MPKEFKHLVVRILVLIAAAVGGKYGYDVFTDVPEASPTVETGSVESKRPEKRQERIPDAPAVERQRPAAKASVESAAKAPRKRCIFASFRDGDWVTGWGTVKKVLPDDTVPPCHQRLLLVDPTGETLLIAHNIDRWPRLAGLQIGDIVEFKGEFKDTERGYLVHWTHPDPAGRRPGGYIRRPAGSVETKVVGP